MKNYTFGAGGLRLGERVEIRTTKQRGVLVGEAVHISGCNTYQVLLSNASKDDPRQIVNIDYLLLRRLKNTESMYGNTEPLTDETAFSPNKLDRLELRTAIKAGKEIIPDIDIHGNQAEDIIIQPGAEVFHTCYGIPMIVNYIYRDIFSRELEYGLTYMQGNKEVSVNSRRGALCYLDLAIDVYPEETEPPKPDDSKPGKKHKADKKGKGKTGPVFDDSRHAIDPGPSIEDFRR